eukprot:gene19699-23338_t
MDTVSRCIGLLNQFLVWTYGDGWQGETSTPTIFVKELHHPLQYTIRVPYRPGACQTAELVGRQPHCPALCGPRTYSSALIIQ